jgi:hypothetical protein
MVVICQEIQNYVWYYFLYLFASTLVCFGSLLLLYASKSYTSTRHLFGGGSLVILAS